jgi:hypothetical protein
MAGGPGPKKRLRLGLFGDASIAEGFVDQKPGQPYIMDTVTFEVLFLQTIPTEISDGSELSYVALAAAGRNVPLYQYTGAEDSISFTVSWYANLDHKQDVLKKVKWLKAISKNNGYSDPPHPVLFSFGELYKKSKWIIVSTNTRWSMFDREKGMMPCLAYTDLELKRISSLNPTRAEMLDINY